MIKQNLPLGAVIFVSLLMLFMSLKVTLFRYQNFEYGKFDLGNMSQMVYNTLHGNFMEVTDYFGANMPRWGMSHVDPFLVVFVPFYALFPDARVLIVAQLALVIFSSILIYFIGLKVIGSKVASALIALAYLFYPALGYVLAWTGFHGVTAIIPFFLGSFLMFEVMDSKKDFSRKNLILFYILIFITLTGKEEISLIILMYGLYLYFFRRQKKIGANLSILGVVWFIFAFLVLIPRAAHYRVEGYEKFAASVELSTGASRDVLKPNYFLSRYEEFGNTYFEIAKNMVLNPQKVLEEFFSGDKKENFNMTFAPVGYLPLLSIPTLAIALPEFLINYLTTQGGIGTAEIYNHRISMIIPILFVSLFFSINFLQSLSHLILKRKFQHLPSFVALVILGLSLYTSNAYQNPILLWFTQSVQKRLSLDSFRVAFAEEGEEVVESELKPGDKAKINRLETKDRTCFDGVLDLITPDSSVSSPDYLGAHLSTRRVNALFPANFDSADFVVVDVYSRKVLTILGVDQDLINTVVGKVVRDPNYKLTYSCSNIFLFSRVGEHQKEDILPLQESYDYEPKFDYPIGSSLHLVDMALPESIEKGDDFQLKFVYQKEGNDSLNSYIIYTTFKNTQTEEKYQIANLPSFGIRPPSEWSQDIYYLEDNTFVLPPKLSSGVYQVYVGMTNSIKTYNIYLGGVEVK